MAEHLETGERRNSQGSRNGEEGLGLFLIPQKKPKQPFLYFGDKHNNVDTFALIQSPRSKKSTPQNLSVAISFRHRFKNLDALMEREGAQRIYVSCGGWFDFMNSRPTDKLNEWEIDFLPSTKGEEKEDPSPGKKRKRVDDDVNSDSRERKTKTIIVGYNFETKSLYTRIEGEEEIKD